MDKMIKVTVADIRQAGFCVSGIKQFCQQHNIDFRELIKDGIDITELEHIDDIMVKQVIEQAIERGNK